MPVMLAFVFLILAAACNDIGAADLDTCLTSAYGDATFVKTDERNKRVFLVWPADTPIDKAAILHFIRGADACLRKEPAWAKTYSVSLFSDMKFAGYKTEPHILPFVKSDEWLAAYLAEFDRETSTIILLPALGGEHIQVSDPFEK